MNLNLIVRNHLFIDIDKYLSLSWMGAPLKFDGTISVCGMGTSVLLRHPNIASHSNLDARNYRMRGTTLSATATTVTIKWWKIMINKFFWKEKRKCLRMVKRCETIWKILWWKGKTKRFLRIVWGWSLNDLKFGALRWILRFFSSIQFSENAMI